MKFAFVILNYNTASDVEKCIQSVLNISVMDELAFVIVDNASNPEDKKQLNDFVQKLLCQEIKVQLLEMEKNTGYSIANNAGYQVAKDQFLPDFICISNSDIEICQQDFFEKIKELYQEHKFDLLGPDIYVPRKKLHQSPVLGRKVWNEQFVLDEIKKCEKKIAILQQYKDKAKKTAIIDLKHQGAWKNILKNIRCVLLKKGYVKEYNNEYLHGAFLICSKEYMERYDKCFEPEVFLYGEEDLLLLKCISNKNKMLYSPKIQVRHYSGGSMKNKSKETDVERQLSYWKLELESKKVLLKEQKCFGEKVANG